jgi:hypothetical protein
VGDHVPLEELQGATTIQPPGREVDHLPWEELQTAEPADRVGDDADFQWAKSHGQRRHGGRKALQNVPRKWGRTNQSPKSRCHSEPNPKERTNFETIYWSDRQQKSSCWQLLQQQGQPEENAVPEHTTTANVLSKLPTEPCKNFEQTSTSRLFEKPNSTKTTSTGGEALEPHIGNGGLAMQETRGSHQQSLPELIQHIVQFNPQRSKRDIIYMAKSRKRQNRAERKQLQRGAKLLNSTSATRVLLCKRPGPATKIAAKNHPNALPNSFRNSTKGTALTRRIRGSANDQQRIRTLHKMLSVISRDLPETRGRL